MDESWEERIARLVAPEIRALSAYHVADSEGLVKLDAMENPYDWPEELVEAWLARLRGVHVNRYPDPRADGLKERLREVMAVPADAGILLGNGSDELIQLLVHTLGGPGSVVLTPDPSFAMYGLLARVSGRRLVTVALGENDFGLRAQAMLEAVGEQRPVLTFIAYPNNPTGNLFDADDIVAIVEASPGVVVVDEAYAPFARASFMARLGEFPNLLVLRTVSKLGLAGLRLGMLAGAPAWIAELDKLRLPYNLSVLTQASAELALDHYPVFAEQTGRISADRDTLYRRLEKVRGIRVWPSRANFLLLRSLSMGGSDLAAALREHGVLIKDVGAASPLLEDCLRVTVGRPEENEALVDALEAILSGTAGGSG
jgi:histidinol-phosphate aminotransferase